MKECLTCKSKKEDVEFKLNSNKCKSCISDYQREYRNSHKKESKEYFKDYYIKNKEDILNKVKEYYIDNKEKISEYKKEHAIKNKDKIQEYLHNYYIENKDRLDDINKKYAIENRNSIKIKRNERNRINRDIINNSNRNRRLNDPVYRVSQNIRTYIRYSIRSKGIKKRTKTQNILGCSFEEFKIYLESKFEPWMSWDNYGKYNDNINQGWDIDHIIPISSAKSEEELIKLNDYTNLQPLCSYINRVIKRDRYDD